MKISATIICKNEQECIQRCLDSLFLIDEIVVCDTGSTDNTMEILRAAQKTMPDGKLVIVEHPWDDHFAAARNACLKHATGDWCVIIDCDETLDSFAVINLTKQILSYPEAKTFRFLCTSAEHENNKHWMVRAHKREAGIFWKGRIHEALNHDDVIQAEGCGIHYGYSPAHALDPDRCLRLLKREHDDAINAGKEPEPRILYYLAREYWYRKDYQQAIFYFTQRTKTMGFRPECADAWLYIARCYWITQHGDNARGAALNAILLAPEFKEAFLLLAEMSFPEEAASWLKYAQYANNTGILFNRTA